MLEQEEKLEHLELTDVTESLAVRVLVVSHHTLASRNVCVLLPNFNRSYFLLPPKDYLDRLAPRASVDQEESREFLENLESKVCREAPEKLEITEMLE